jgi:hypothetical protein
VGAEEQELVAQGSGGNGVLLLLPKLPVLPSVTATPANVRLAQRDEA